MGKGVRHWEANIEYGTARVYRVGEPWVGTEHNGTVTFTLKINGGATETQREELMEAETWRGPLP